ncbi:MAG: hypothetical protein ACI9KE_003318 [Polyangiales bacterium]
MAAQRLVAGPGSFDLAIGDEGPVLLFGPPSSNGGGVRALSLGPMGEALGPERVLLGGGGVARDLAPQADEIVALAHGGRLRVAWVERDQLSFKVRSMLLDAQATSPGEATLVDSTTRTYTGRGSLALAVHDGGFALFHRREDGPCEDGGSSMCARFAVHHEGSTSGRRGGGLAIPTPCHAPIVGFASTGAVWYQTVCALEDGVPRSTVFGLQFEPQYAHAEHVLNGCTPRAMAQVNEGVLITSECNGGKGAYIENAGRNVVELSGTPQLECTSEGVVWRWGSISQPLRAPRAQVEGMLPNVILSEHARAVWTGESLLIAEALGDELSLRRFECDDGRFRRTDHEAL